MNQESLAVHEYSSTEQQESTNQELTDTAHHIEHDPKTTSASRGDGETVTESEALQMADDVGETGITFGSENNKQGDTKLEYQDEAQPSEVVTELPTLPTIKVLYQDNEISLFPPREGDSSETFFLEDEGLGSESLAELLKACRQVLGDYIVEGEELTFDIDSLNLHLTEESPHTSSITLFQIIEVYLHLCHNDGLDPPEPLYITLDTKSNFMAEFSNLIAAAHDGQGLSSLHKDLEFDHEDTSGNAHHDGKMRSPESEVHGEIQEPESATLEHDAQTINVEDQPRREEPQYEGHDEPQDEHLEQPEDERLGEPQDNQPQGEEPQYEAQYEAHDEPQDEHLEQPEDERLGEPQYEDQDELQDEQLEQPEDERLGEPQDKSQQEPQFQQVPQGELLNETRETHTEQADYNQDYLSDTEVPADLEPHEPHPTDVEPVGDYEEQVSNAKEGSFEAKEPIVGDDNEQILGVENDSHEEPQHIDFKVSEEGELGAGTTTDGTQTNNYAEQPTEGFENATVSDSSHTAGNIEYDGGNFQQGEIEDEQDDDIDLGYGDESAGLDANITVADESNEQEEPRDKLENPASPKEDLFEFDDQDYESPGTLGQPSTAQSAVDPDFNQETDATAAHPEGLSVEENRGEEPMAEPSEDQEKHSPIHDDREQDEIEEIDAFDEDGQYDESVNPNEKGESHPVEVPSLESGECSPSPPKDGTHFAIQQDDVAFKIDEAADSVVSSHHIEVESVDTRGLQTDDRMIAKTPDPLEGLYEIDEDLFKSPAKDLDNSNAPAGEVASIPSAGVSYSKRVTYDSDEIDFDDDEDDENTKELGSFGFSADAGDQISNNGSQSSTIPYYYGRRRFTSGVCSEVLTSSSSSRDRFADWEPLFEIWSPASAENPKEPNSFVFSSSSSSSKSISSES